jgi:hypothetical protein
MSRTRFIVTVGFVVACIAAITPTHTRAQAPAGVVDAVLTAQMASAGEASYLVYMKENANLSQVSIMADREAQGWAAYNALTSVASRTQGPLLSYLRQPGRATVVKSFFSRCGISGCRSHHAGARTFDSRADPGRRGAESECDRVERREGQGA